MAINPVPSRRVSGEWTPNQLAKRDAIVRATAQLLTRTGIHGCTSRAIATAGNCSTSALHYYFRDQDEIVDLAFRHLAGRFWERVRRASGNEVSSESKLRAAASSYLESATETNIPAALEFSTTLLWYELQAASVRAGKIETARELADVGREMLSELLSQLRPENHRQLAEVLYSALIGASMRNSLTPRPTSDILDEIWMILDLPMAGEV